MAKVLKTEEMNKCIGCFTCMLVCAGVNRKNHSISKSCISVKTSGGISGRFVSVVCQACREPQCAEVCPSDALTQRKGGGVTLDKTVCIGCRRCEEACIVEAIKYDEDERKPIICHHCGVCVRFCPHGCLEMQEVSD
ncbi:MAG: 4Fe-4S binding protein [Oscillospiraceae bacterium]|nr:4Fe-4S binding protein [Oscillospiraceae bacterium]